MATFTQYAMIATYEALNDAKWFPDDKNKRERTGVAVGSGIGSIEEIMTASEHIYNKVRRFLSCICLFDFYDVKF
jgi:3-oxoacyl-(acyl-carrier-protein) synthase